MSNYIKVLPPGNVWQRPTDWLPIPTVGANEEVFYGLHAVWDTTVNPVVLLCTGNYTVDWGDGTITNHASNTKAEKNYVYSAVTSVVCTRGYKMAMIKVTPQAGQTITNLSLRQTHTNYNYVLESGFLEIVSNFSNIGFSGFVSSSILANRIEHITLKSANSSINIDYSFYNLKSLSKLVIKSLTNLNYSAFINSLPSLKELDIDKTQIQTLTICHINNVPNIDLSYLTMPNITNGGSLYFNNGLPIKGFINIPNPTLTNISFMFRDCVVVTLPSYNLINVTSADNLFFNTSRCVKRSLLYNIKVTHSYANQLLDTTALNEIFTNLGTANAGASITITGNPGAATCNQSIATAKGWTVIN